MRNKALVHLKLNLFISMKSGVSAINFRISKTVVFFSLLVKMFVAKMLGYYKV